jgi:hypothetical protein
MCVKLLARRKDATEVSENRALRAKLGPNTGNVTRVN